MTSILDLSITRSSISIESEALAVPVNSGFHRENRTLTASNQTIIRGFESPSVVNYQLLQPRMVKRLTQMAISISRRGYYGISQTKGAYRGYLICSLRARRSIGRSQAFGDWGSTFESLRARKWRGMRSGISAHPRMSGNLKILGMDYMEVRIFPSPQEPGHNPGSFFFLI